MALLGLAQARLGAGADRLRGDEPLLARPGGQHFPPCPSRCRAPPGRCCSEQSDSDGEAQARAALSKRCCEAALEQGHVDDAVVAESLAQSQALWHLRESIPLAQSQEGPNIKHDISLPVSAIPELRARAPTPRCRRPSPACALVNFGHLGDGNLHYNVQAPEGMPAQDFLDQHEHAVNRLVYDAVRRAAARSPPNMASAR